MPTEQRGRSDLLTFIGTVVGHGAAPHPVIDDGFVGVFVVRIPGRWIICMTEGDKPYDWPSARAGLGQQIPGDRFAPFARRGLRDSVPFAEVRRITEESMAEMGFRFEWWEGAAAGEAPSAAREEEE